MTAVLKNSGVYEKAQSVGTITLKRLSEISKIVAHADDWRAALNQIVKTIRPGFIFDNLAVYLTLPEKDEIEAAYARAVGRGRKAEADIAWGEALANRVIAAQQTVLEEPATPEEVDRLERPYLLGIPLTAHQRRLGAVIFIRFGGPVFTQPDVQLAELLSHQIAVLIEHNRLRQAYRVLENQQQQSLIQEDFLSTITHELRSPLGFIKGYTTTLLRDDATWDYRSQQEFLKIIDHETDQLRELIENLTDSARLHLGQLNMVFQPVRLDGLINDIITRARLHYPSLTIHVEKDNALPPVEADSRRLAQVFENLISNAHKYAPGSDIFIRIYRYMNGCRIEFKDNGPGIAGQYLPYIFERFFRTPDCPPNIHGSGLGLYICKQILQAHQGNITAISAPDEGTTFLIFLPLKPGQKE